MFGISPAALVRSTSLAGSTLLCTRSRWLQSLESCRTAQLPRSSTPVSSRRCKLLLAPVLVRRRTLRRKRRSKLPNPNMKSDKSQPSRKKNPSLVRSQRILSMPYRLVTLTWMTLNASIPIMMKTNLCHISVRILIAKTNLFEWVHTCAMMNLQKSS